MMGVVEKCCLSHLLISDTVPNTAQRRGGLFWLVVTALGWLAVTGSQEAERQEEMGDTSSQHAPSVTTPNTAHLATALTSG